MIIDKLRRAVNAKQKETTEVRKEEKDSYKTTLHNIVL